MNNIKFKKKGGEEMQEIWKDINGFEGCYQISNYGNVRSLDRIKNHRLYYGQIMSQSTDKDGYKDVALRLDGKRKYFRVHRLVAEAFVHNPKPDIYNIINHKDGVVDNNKADNLEWCDTSYNQWHRCHVNNHPPTNEWHRKKVKAIMPNGEEKYFNSAVECAKYFNVSSTAIKNKINGISSNPSYRQTKNTVQLKGVRFEYCS